MSLSRPKIAVIGSGASALGVVSGLLERGYKGEIIIFDHGVDRDLDPPEKTSLENAEEFYNEIYRKIRKNYPYKFPPPKTHFGNQIPKI
ncbi:MAG: hypothetical protein IIB38_13230, partial [Candidatus Hydrogenedentes bacterium]|nr:hypothetical protein [Candidatus Hydrogenedentota bacterium]